MFEELFEVCFITYRTSLFIVSVYFLKESVVVVVKSARDDAAGASDCFEEYFGLRSMAAEIAPGMLVMPDEGGLALSANEGLKVQIKFSGQSFDCFHRLLSKATSPWRTHLNSYTQNRTAVYLG